MFEKIYNLKNKKKGFTLVELIVVLVILAILLAVLVPSMTQWITRAKGQQVMVSARTVYLACQTVGAEAYGRDQLKKDATGEYSGLDENLSTGNITVIVKAATGETVTVAGTVDSISESIAKLAGLNSPDKYTFSCKYKSDGTIDAFTYTAGNQQVTLTNGQLVAATVA